MSSGDEIGKSTVLPQMQWHFRNFHLQSRGIAPKKQHNSDKNQFRLKVSGTLPRLSVFV